MLTRIGLGSHAFAWACGAPGPPQPAAFRLTELVEVAQKTGARLLQIADNYSLASFETPEIDAFASACRSRDIAVEVGTRGLEIRDLHLHLALARRLKSTMVRVGTDLGIDQPSPTEIVDRLELVAAEYRSSGVRIALDNHGRFAARTWLRIVQTLGEDFVGICLDPGHAFAALESPEHVVEVLAPCTLGLLVRDFTVRRAPSECGFVIEGCPVGTGRLNVPWLLDTLESASRNRFNAVVTNWVAPGPDASETIAREQAWAEQGVGFLRRLISA